ncbi:MULTISPECIES: hypothetical protein [unclassified Caulobacter]|uniref:hypothetical protein n=1 Tax=unclassified Caulobacter TaxID=2648921 RepID=UPI0011B7591C|nr:MULTISPECIES: hypothetical protein [unclassified Caulobacter]
MEPQLIERIRSFGHWRVNLRPLGTLTHPLSFEQAAKIVDENRVAVRGWDFPHIQRHNGASGAAERGENYVENWCDWDGQIEFWRMYRSGQFLAYKALHYEVPNSMFYTQGKSLFITDSIFAVTEFLEFAHRLFIHGAHSNGTVVFIDLNNTRDRNLQTGPGRMPFWDLKTTKAETIKLKRTVHPDEWSEGAANVANSLLLELFDHFGWNPPQSQISAEQEKFYRRDFR